MYILDWILVQQLGISYIITHNLSEASSFNGVVICYDDHAEIPHAIRIKPQGLLFQKGITAQSLAVNRWRKSTVLFYNQPGATVPFDIFAAAFYMLSRYEEYLPHNKDKHGRFKPEDSVAAQFSFLQQPVVDEWVHHFGKLLQSKHQIQLRKKEFEFVPTYDLDLAWQYKYKGLKRTMAGIAKDLMLLKLGSVVHRIMVLSGLRKDAFQNFEDLKILHQNLGLNPLLFVLLGQHGAFDKNTNPHFSVFQQLIKNLAKQYNIGIHPSYASDSDAGKIQAEQQLLATIINKTITQSRQHYIKFSLPNTYEALLQLGIQHDYSMGYAARNGFRAGTSNTFHWYHLPNETATNLAIHPFAFMDATALFYQKQNHKAIYLEWMLLWQAVKKVNGTFISIAHNHLMGRFEQDKSFATCYKRILKDCKQDCK